MSESSNNMFETARNGSWLYTLDAVLMKMIQRIALLREKHLDKVGVVEKVFSFLQNAFQECARFQVLQVNGAGKEFIVIHQASSAMAHADRYTIDIDNSTCECGLWQEYGYPCVHAMSYFRLHQKMSMMNIIDRFVDRQYTYETRETLLRENIHAVCMDHIELDGQTLPPKQSTTRITGRPKKKRIRKRSRFAFDQDQSNIVCSKCHKRGHNVRTCDASAVEDLPSSI